MARIVVDVLCGGPSAEHDVSLVSASAVVNGLMKGSEGMAVHPLYWHPQGAWYRMPDACETTMDPDKIKALALSENSLTPVCQAADGRSHDFPAAWSRPDCVFPVLHGPFGEDGCIQGLLDILRFPYVGCGVLASSVGMDKSVFRELLKAHDLPCLPWLAFTGHEYVANTREIENTIRDTLAFPLFVKPSRQGSSIGISKVKVPEDLSQAIREALVHDTKIVVEQGIEGREIECAVLGNYDLLTAPLGEIIPGAEFYDYQDKYESGQTRLILPAKIDLSLVTRIQATAKDVFRLIDGRGLARVDFFLEPGSDQYYVNEVNTMPGFTAQSMYPQMWQAADWTFPQLLEKLIHLGMSVRK